MNLAGRLVGWMLEHERRGTPKPPAPVRPEACPRCGTLDIHGERPCPLRTDLENNPAAERHDWHCHGCAWSVYVGDEDW